MNPRIVEPTEHDAFRFYVIQDALYLSEYARASPCVRTRHLDYEATP